MKKTYLLTPGPTPIPERVLQSQAATIPHHRTPEFEKLFGAVQLSLQSLFQTSQPVLTLASSGTGAMEAALVNLFSPGDRVICLNAGKFGERWVKLAKAYGLDPFEVRAPTGEALGKQDLETARAQIVGPIAGVLFQANETSTGVALPTQEITQWCQENQCLSVCDAITACGVIPLPMDAWGIDALITGSQKALMIPPGLAFIALSEKAWARQSQSRLPKFYFDLARERKLQAKNQTAWTPAISLICGLHASFLEIEKTGWPVLFRRFDVLARATRAGVLAMGLELLSPNAPSTSVTAVQLPMPPEAGAKIPKIMRDRYGVVVAGGQDELQGKIVRLSHLGYMGPFDMMTALQALEWSLCDQGANIRSGSGVAGALQVLTQERDILFS